MAALFVWAAAAGQDREYHFRFLVSAPEEIDRLTRILSIDNVVRDTVTAYASEAQWQRFRVLGYRLLDTNVVPLRPAGSVPARGRPRAACRGTSRRNHEIHHRHAPGGAGRACHRRRCTGH